MTHLEQLVHAVVSSRLDYCNSLFVGITKENIYISYRKYKTLQPDLCWENDAETLLPQS